MQKKKFILIYLITSTVYSLSIDVPSKTPLGITADKQFLWVGDARSSLLYGYNMRKNTFIREKKISLPNLRDFTFYNNTILTVLKNRIYVIDPITGNILKKKILKNIKNAISIAHSEKLIYIFDAKSQKIWRYDFERNIYLGSFKAPAKKVRGMSFYRDSLWITSAKENDSKNKSRVFKVNPHSGSILATLDMKQEIFGLGLIQGKIHISTRGKVFEFDLQENDNFITYNPRKIHLSGRMTTKALWSKKQVVIRESLKTTFSAFPLSPRQRPQRLKMKPRYKKRKRLFAGDSMYVIGYEDSQKDAVHNINIDIKLSQINYTFNKKNIAIFKPKKPENKELLYYLKYNKNEKQSIFLAQQYRDLTLNKWHPYQAIESFYKKNSTIKISQLIAYLRKLGVPARKAYIWHTEIGKIIKSIEFYCDPMGWVIISHTYSPSLPKFFPIPNTWLSLYYPESVKISPRPLTKDLKPIRIPQEVIRWNLKTRQK